MVCSDEKELVIAIQLSQHLNSPNHLIVTLFYKQSLDCTVNMNKHAYINTMKYDITHNGNSSTTSKTLNSHVHKKNKTKQTKLTHFNLIISSLNDPKRSFLGQRTMRSVRKLWNAGTWTGLTLSKSLYTSSNLSYWGTPTQGQDLASAQKATAPTLFTLLHYIMLFFN